MLKYCDLNNRMLEIKMYTYEQFFLYKFLKRKHFDETENLELKKL